MQRASIRAAAIIAAAIGVANADDNSQFGGKWRVTQGVIAPWSDEAGAGAPSLDIGASVKFGAKSVAAPHPVGCSGARYEATENPAEGLFQSGLSEPAEAAMKSLGIAGPLVKGFSVSCDSGVFEYHWADENTLLTALDNRIWTLSRTAGTRAAKTSPEGVVQRFLESHFAGDMGFWPSALDGRRGFFTSSLNAAMDDYFARITDPDEAPEINGDPFTDAQDLPTRFAVAADDRKADGVSIDVVFSDAYATKSVRYAMAREKGRWLIDDLAFADGTRLKELLTQ